MMNNKKHQNMLSEHFTLEEMSYSRIAVENAIDNTPSPAPGRRWGIWLAICWNR